MTNVLYAIGLEWVTLKVELVVILTREEIIIEDAWTGRRNGKDCSHRPLSPKRIRRAETPKPGNGQHWMNLEQQHQKIIKVTMRLCALHRKATKKQKSR